MHLTFCGEGAEVIEVYFYIYVVNFRNSKPDDIYKNMENAINSNWFGLRMRSYLIVGSCFPASDFKFF